MIPKIYVSLVIQAEAITVDMLDRFRALGATDCWIKGQYMPSTTYTNNGCRFSSEPEYSYYADEVAIAFINNIIVSNTEIFDITHEYDIRPMLTIAAYASDVLPSCVLESDDVRLLAKYNISLNIDYMLVSDELEN